MTDYGFMFSVPKINITDNIKIQRLGALMYSDCSKYTLVTIGYSLDGIFCVGAQTKSQDDTSDVILTIYYR